MEEVYKQSALLSSVVDEHQSCYSSQVANIFLNLTASSKKEVAKALLIAAG